MKIVVVKVKNMKRVLPSYTVLALVTCASFATEAQDKKEQPWSGNVQFGLSPEFR